MMRPLRLKDLDYTVLQQCMHCGMCLPACPTYESTKRERHSPRGRISLMRAVADGDLNVGQELADEMNYCLGCLACTTACPAGVDYTTLFETARAEIESAPGLTSWKRRFLRSLTLDHIFLYPNRLHLLGRLLRLYQQSGVAALFRRLRLPFLLGKSIGRLEPMTPRMSERFSDERIAQWEYPPEGVTLRGKVGMLTGCIQSIAFSGVNRDTVDVLLHNGWAVFTPRLQACCGSIHAHNGAPDIAARSGLKLMGQFGREFKDLTAIISNASGCGSHLKHYRKQFAEKSVEQARAGQWDAKVKDIHEFLIETGFRVPVKPPLVHQDNTEKPKLTYHESCHLCHGQGIRSAPKQILDSLPAWCRVELLDSDKCCGSAGIYNLLQPDESERILQRKLEQITRTGAVCVVTSNPGCHLQIENGLKKEKLSVEVTQPVSLLAQAYREEFIPQGLG